MSALAKRFEPRVRTTDSQFIQAVPASRVGLIQTLGFTRENRMAPPSNDDLHQQIVAQQKQITHLEMRLHLVENLSQRLFDLFQIQTVEIGDLKDAQQIFTRLVMAASPEIKAYVVSSTSQALLRPDAIKSVLRNQISALNKAASSLSITTPEGRRTQFQIIFGDMPESET